MSWNLDEAFWPGPPHEYKVIYCEDDYLIQRMHGFEQFQGTVIPTTSDVISRVDLNEEVDVVVGHVLICHGYLNSIEIERMFFGSKTETKIIVSSKQIVNPYPSGPI